jgi:hypothetical protein
MISRVNKQATGTITRHIENLIALAEKNKNELVVKQMKVIVAEYKSKNSFYEKLDVIEMPDLISVSA